MQAIVPLAGPDFLDPRYGVKPLVEVDGEPLIRRAITSRSWWRSGRLRPEGLTFVLRDLPEAHALQGQLAEWFPGAAFVYLSDLTGGALLSALAGAALVRDLSAPLVVDLVDILFEIDDAAIDALTDEGVGAAAPWFTSDSAAFSYLVFDARGDVIKTREKVVISNHASAGSYFFRDTAALLRAAAYAFDHAADLTHRGAHFLCPALNGVVAEGRRVLAWEARNVRPISEIFHHKG